MCAGNGLPRQDGREGLEIGPAVHGRDPRARGVALTSDAAACAGGTCGSVGRSAARWSRCCPIVGPTTHTVALELDAVGIVNDAVQYGVAECGIGNHVMPLRHGGLTCDQQ